MTSADNFLLITARISTGVEHFYQCSQFFLDRSRNFLTKCVCDLVWTVWSYEQSWPPTSPIKLLEVNEFCGGGGVKFLFPFLSLPMLPSLRLNTFILFCSKEDLNIAVFAILRSYAFHLPSPFSAAFRGVYLHDSSSAA